MQLAEIAFNGEHSTLADALNEIKRTAQSESGKVQFYLIKIQLEESGLNPSEHRYTSRMEGTMR